MHSAADVSQSWFILLVWDDSWVRGLYYYRGLCKDVFNGSVVLLLLIAVCWVYAVSVDSFVGGWLFCVGG